MTSLLIMGQFTVLLDGIHLVNDSVSRNLGQYLQDEEL